MSNDQPVLAAPLAVDVDPSPGAPGPCLVWKLPAELRGISSSIIGGGIGLVSWVLNMTVDTDYGRLDPDRHLLNVAQQLQLDGPGIGMMTAVDVNKFQTAQADGVSACATVGVSRPVWAAELADTTDCTDATEPDSGPGTINLIVTVPVLLSDAALVNAVCTATEAKVQALLDHGVDGTGTASDAVAVLCVTDGTAEQFGGPRSTWGARIARVVYDATAAGVVAQRR